MNGSGNDQLGSLLAGRLLHSSSARHGQQHNLVVIKDSLAVSGLFIMQLMLKLCLQSGHRVLLVTVEQSLERYKAVLRKLGMSLQPLLDSGQLVVVSAPRGSEPAALRQLTASIALAAAKIASVDDGQHAVAETAAKAPALTILIDSVSDLSCLANSQAEWTTFLHYCTSLGAKLSQVAVNCLLRIHSDLTDQHHTQGLLEHAAKVVMDVQPVLTDGSVADIHGQIILRQRSCNQAALPGTAVIESSAESQRVQVEQTVLFRAGDLGVTWVEHLTTQHLLWS